MASRADGTGTDSALPAEARAAADRGNVVSAVKLTREGTGLGLKEAKDSVDAYLRGTGGMLAPATGATDIPSDAVAFLYQGKLLDAIKTTRAKTGLGLKDAKEAVERHLASNPTTRQRFRAAAAEERRGLVRAVKIVIAIGLVILAYSWLSGRI